MPEKVLRLLAAHASAAAFSWGAFKALFPFPTPSFFLLAGAELARGGAGPGAAFARVLWRIALPGAAGGVLGAYPYYYFARRGGRPVVGRWAPWLGIRRERLKGWEREWTRRRGKLNLVLMAASLVSLLLGALLSGLCEAAFWEYASWAFLGGAARCLILGLAGWRMRAYGDPIMLFRPVTLIMGCVLILAVGLGIVYVRIRGSRASGK